MVYLEPQNDGRSLKDTRPRSGMRREGELGIVGAFATDEANVREGGMIIVSVGNPSLLMARFEGTRDGGSAFESRQSSLGFRRVVDDVTVGPFRTAGETSEETRPGEDCEKGEKCEKEDSRVEDEASVVELVA